MAGYNVIGFTQFAAGCFVLCAVLHLQFYKACQQAWASNAFEYRPRNTHPSRTSHACEQPNSNRLGCVGGTADADKTVRRGATLKRMCMEALNPPAVALAAAVPQHAHMPAAAPGGQATQPSVVRATPAAGMHASEAAAPALHPVLRLSANGCSAVRSNNTLPASDVAGRGVGSVSPETSRVYVVRRAHGCVTAVDVASGQSPPGCMPWAHAQASQTQAQAGRHTPAQPACTQAQRQRYALCDAPAPAPATPHAQAHGAEVVLGRPGDHQQFVNRQPGSTHEMPIPEPATPRHAPWPLNNGSQAQGPGLTLGSLTGHISLAMAACGYRLVVRRVVDSGHYWSRTMSSTFCYCVLPGTGVGYVVEPRFKEHFKLGCMTERYR